MQRTGALQRLGTLQGQDQERCSIQERYRSVTGALQERYWSVTGALQGQDEECCSVWERYRSVARADVAGAGNSGGSGQEAAVASEKAAKL